MKIQQYNGQVATMTVVTKLRSVQERKFKTKNDAEFSVIYVCTDNGCFTSYKNNFDKLAINLDYVQEGDLVEITYYLKDGKWRTFTNIRILPKDA